MIHCNMDTEIIKEKRDKKEKKIFKMEFEDIFFVR